MQRRNSSKPASKAEAVVHRVDTVNRELAVLVDGGLVNFDVAPDCTIFLRGERVKLRMVQPGDHVQVIYTELRGFLVARTIEVQPGYPAPLLP